MSAHTYFLLFFCPSPSSHLLLPLPHIHHLCFHLCLCVHACVWLPFLSPVFLIRDAACPAVHHCPPATLVDAGDLRLLLLYTQAEDDQDF